MKWNWRCSREKEREKAMREARMDSMRTLNMMRVNTEKLL